jgi:hypothetical protein
MKTEISTTKAKQSKDNTQDLTIYPKAEFCHPYHRNHHKPPKMINCGSMIINHLQLKGYQKIKLQGSLTAIPWLHDLFQESFKI